MLNVDRVVGRWLKAVEDCAKEEEGLRALLESVSFYFLSCVAIKLMGRFLQSAL